MVALIAGIGLFVAVHLSVAAFPGLRSSLSQRLGAQVYRGVFSLVAVAALVLIVIGWRSSPPVAVYAPPSWGRMAALPLMFASVFLFGASHAKTNVKRVLRHPQLSAIVLWSVAHLLANGDIRSLTLFASLGVWALVEMPLINRRDGAWQKPAPAAMRSEAIALAITVIVFLVLIALHRYYAGVSPLPV